MEANSKFIELLEKQKTNLSYIKEDKFVRGNENSELPDEDEEEDIDIPDDDNIEQQDTETQEEPEQQPPTVFSDREQDILRVALELYRSNDQYSIESKNEFSNLYESGDYEALLGRLIAIADELID